MSSRFRLHTWVEHVATFLVISIHNPRLPFILWYTLLFPLNYTISALIELINLLICSQHHDKKNDCITEICGFYGNDAYWLGHVEENAYDGIT